MASRARFNSLDSGLILSAPSKTVEHPAQPRSASASESPIQDINVLNGHTEVVSPSYLATDENSTPPLLAPPNSTTGSIAIRAMRSMRSVARLTTWTNGKPTEKENKSAVLVPVQTKDDEKRTKSKGKRKFEFGRDQTASRFSGNSSETGVPSGPHPHPTHLQPPITKKSGVLGLGFPSGFRFGTVRSSSGGSSDRISHSSTGDPPPESQTCSSSTLSTASSLRPRSAMSRISSSSSASVKWVEDRLDTVRVACRRERRDETQRNFPGERSSANVADIHFETSSRLTSSKSNTRPSLPAIAIEEAWLNGQSLRVSEPGATPNKYNRIRPASDQMIGKDRLRSIRGVGEGEFHPVI